MQSISQSQFSQWPKTLAKRLLPGRGQCLSCWHHDSESRHEFTLLLLCCC